MYGKSVKTLSPTGFALSLALVLVLAPVATDMYLASMPDIAGHLQVSYAKVQLSLSVFLLAQGAGQLFWAPSSTASGGESRCCPDLCSLPPAPSGQAAPTLWAY